MVRGSITHFSFKPSSSTFPLPKGTTLTLLSNWKVEYSVVVRRGVEQLMRTDFQVLLMHSGILIDPLEVAL